MTVTEADAMRAGRFGHFGCYLIPGERSSHPPLYTDGEGGGEGPAPLLPLEARCWMFDDVRDFTLVNTNIEHPTLNTELPPGPHPSRLPSVQGRGDQARTPLANRVLHPRRNHHILPA